MSKDKEMTNSPTTVESIDSKLEKVVEVIVKIADEQARANRVSDERMTRIETNLDRQERHIDRLVGIVETLISHR